MKSAYIRATMGGTGVDERWHFNVSAALSVGIKVGHYHLLRPEASGEMQARHILTKANPQIYSLAIDVERVVGAEYPQDYPSKRAYAGVLADLITRLHGDTGKYPVIYTSWGEWNALIDGDEEQNELFKKCLLWIAGYRIPAGREPLLPHVWDKYWLWQFTSEGRVPGMPGRDFDLNRFKEADKENDTPFSLYTPFKNWVVPNNGQFNAPRDFSFAPHRLQIHEGIDGVDGDNPGAGEIYCGRAGKITKVGYDARGYGDYLIVDFGDGWSAWYCHFKKITVHQGDQVREFESLGIAGSTGNSTGVHCHLTLCNPVIGLDNYVVRKVIDPAPYLMKW